MGGLITLDDLAHYSPKIREVLRAKYENGAHTWEVLTSPPPSSGGVAVIEALNMLQGVPLKGWGDPQSVHMVAETMRRVFADRAEYLADPDSSHVTFSAVFLLNYEMDDFTTQPGVPNALFGLIQSEANAIAPGHRPLSSMTPTILLRDGKLSFVTGSPGGPTIISATLLSVINWMRLGMDAQEAINAPRFHHQWLPDQIFMEEDFPEGTQKALEARGFTVKRRGHIGLVNAIGIDAK